VLLDLLEPDIGEQVQAATLQTIVCALVDEWDNIRVAWLVASLTIDIRGAFWIGINNWIIQKKGHKSRRSVIHILRCTNLSVKILEFLYFYLIPEPSLPKSASPASSSSENSSGRSSGSDSSSSSSGIPPIIRRTTEEKKGMVGKLVGGEKGVEGLVRDLQEFRPFGDIG
jgi:hypothetical protein